MAETKEDQAARKQAQQAASQSPDIPDHLRAGESRAVSAGGNVRIEKHQLDGQMYSVEVPKEAYQEYINGDKSAARAFPELSHEQYRFVTARETPSEVKAEEARWFGETDNWLNWKSEERGQTYGIEP